jgi:DNA polymerase-3 subunit chi
VTEVLFYHLVGKPPEAVLPGLLERSLKRGWRAVVQAGSSERVEAIDAYLWTYTDESYLPHGTAKDGRAGEQPVYLTQTGENPNGAAIRFLLEGAPVPDDLSAYERLVVMVSGDDEAAVAAARAQWKALKAARHELTYWQQDGRGAWVRKA